MATAIKPARNNNKCGVIVFRRKDNRFLIVKNRTSQFWGFPKGHQEDGETTIETAIRELKEEAGISIKDTDIIYSLKKRSWYLYVVLLDNVFVKIDNNEICEFKWVDYSTFTKYNMSKGTAMFMSFEIRNNMKEGYSKNKEIMLCELEKIEEILRQTNLSYYNYRRYSMISQPLIKI